MIIEAKEFSKEIRKVIKQSFKQIKNLSIQTRNDKIFIRWNDIDLDEVAPIVENFINEHSEVNYINMKEVELWREHSLEYINNNKEWNKEKRYKTIKFVNKVEIPETENSMIANFATVVYEDQKVNVVFTNSKESNVVTFDYKKSWSHKKYIEKAMNENGIKLGFGFQYTWDMTAV